MKSIVTPPRTVALLLILFVAAATRLWGLGFGLPYTQARPDETFIIDGARALLSGQLPRFYDYPWLYIFMVALLYVGYFVWGAITGTFNSVADMIASWPFHWQPFFLISRALSAAFGIATVYVVYRLGRRLWDETTGLIAAFLLSVAFINVRDSHFGTTDAALTFFIVGSMALLMDAHLSGRRSRFLAAGVVAGLGAATKYNAVLLGPSILVSYAVHIAGTANRREAARDPRIWQFTIPFLCAFAIGIPFVVLDRARFLDAMRLLMQSMQQGHGEAAGLGLGWVHHIRFSLRYGIGIPLLIAGAAGMVLLLIKQPGVGLVLLSFPLLYYGVAGSIRNLFFRYIIPIVPFLCLTAAFAIERLTSFAVDRWARTASARTQQLRVAAAAAAIAVGVAAPSMWSIWQFDRVISNTDNRVLVAQWFQQNVPPGSTVVQSGSPFGHAQFGTAMGLEEWRWDRGRQTFVLRGRPAAGRPDWILLQESPLPSQTQPVIRDLLHEGYVQVTAFTAVRLGDDLVYDRQDAFYVPFSGLEKVKRPGPNFVLFQRAGLTRDARINHR